MNVFTCIAKHGEITHVEIREHNGVFSLWLQGEPTALSMSIGDAEQLHDKIGIALREHYASRMVVKV